MASRLESSVRAEREGRICRLTPIGELDIATAPVLHGAFDAALGDSAAERIVVDLSELTFMDSAGLHALLTMNAAEHGGRMRIVRGSPAVERLLDIAGVRTHLPLIDSADDPLGPLPPR
jgi:anti-sigma B factor antagonist